MAAKEFHITIKNRYEDIAALEEKIFAFSVENDITDSTRQAMSIVLDLSLIHI